MENSGDSTLTGIITSRKCPACGHHEMGLTTRDGTFVPLRPGTRIQILEEKPEKVPESEKSKAPSAGPPHTGEIAPGFRAWVPGPVRGDRSLGLKYGVMISEDLLRGEMNGKIFQAAYLEKLRNLIEREVHVPVAVILDRFFSAPHLASGNPPDIAFNMWEELEEIRKPVLLVGAWLEKPDEEHLINLIHPKSKEDLTTVSLSAMELHEELTQLSLEEFLGLL